MVNVLIDNQLSLISCLLLITHYQLSCFFNLAFDKPIFSKYDLRGEERVRGERAQGLGFGYRYRLDRQQFLKVSK